MKSGLRQQQGAWNWECRVAVVLMKHGWGLSQQQHHLMKLGEMLRAGRGHHFQTGNGQQQQKQGHSAFGVEAEVRAADSWAMRRSVTGGQMEYRLWRCTAAIPKAHS